VKRNSRKNQMQGGGNIMRFGNNICTRMEPQITATATNARKKKYVIGEIAPGLLMDNSHNACMIIPIENRTSKRRATTTEKGGQ